MKKSSKIFTITLLSLFAILFNIVSGGGYTSLASATECGATYTVDNTTNTITLNKPTETEQQQTETPASCINQELENLDDNITINLNGQKIVDDLEEDIYTIYITKTVIIEDVPALDITTKGEVDSHVGVGSEDDSAITGSLAIKSGIFSGAIRTYNQGTTLTIEGGEFYEVYGEGSTNIVIIGGTFKGSLGFFQKEGEESCPSHRGSLLIKGGEFMLGTDGLMEIVCGDATIDSGVTVSSRDAEMMTPVIFINAPSMGINPTLTINDGTFISNGDKDVAHFPISSIYILTDSMNSLSGKVNLQGGDYPQGILVGSMTESDKDEFTSDGIYNTLIPQDYGLFHTDTDILKKGFYYDGHFIFSHTNMYYWISDSDVSIYKIVNDDEGDSTIPVPDTGAITKTSNDQVSSSTIVTAVLVGIVVATTSACVLIKR